MCERYHEGEQHVLGRYSSGVIVEWYVLEEQKGSFEHWRCKRLEVACLEICHYSRVVSQGVLTGKSDVSFVIILLGFQLGMLKTVHWRITVAFFQALYAEQIMINFASRKTPARINQQETTSQCILGSLAASGHGFFQPSLFLDLAAGPYLVNT